VRLLVVSAPLVGHLAPMLALARRGAGLAVPVKELDAAALTRLISDDDLRTAAAEVHDEIAAMPEPAELVGYLESSRA